MAEAIVQNSTCNLDVAGLCRRLDRAVVELTKSNSAPLTAFRQADLIRVRAYLVEAQSYADYAAKMPELDFVKSGSVPVALPVPPQITGLENDNLWDLAQLIDSLRFEMANSNSSRAPSGIGSHDKTRFDTIVDRANSFIDEHVLKNAPMDYPESAPSIPIPNQGALGV